MQTRDAELNIRYIDTSISHVTWFVKFWNSLGNRVKGKQGNLIWREHDKQWLHTKIIERGKPQNQPKEKTSFLITDLNITVHTHDYFDFCNCF